MYLENKRVLVLGLGITGLSTVKALNHLGARIIVSDSKSKSDLKEFFNGIGDIVVEKYLGNDDLPLETIDLIIKSPGISPGVKILGEAREKNIEVITDIELAYRISKTNNIVAITGTNGKTTATTLVGEIFKEAKYNTYLAGNIGIGILENMIHSKEDDVFIIEASSFQLENTVFFKPKVSLILNITPDHLDWHKSFRNYIQSKRKVLRNQYEDDFTILNYDNELVRQMGDEIYSKIIWFSEKHELDNGVFIQGDNIVIKEGKELIKVLPHKSLNLVLENVLGSIGIAWAMGIDVEIIRKVLSEFKGLEHRIEYVKSIDGISFYNDSKGTNPDSTIKAIEVVNGPIILIAGGYDKGSEYDELIQGFNGKVKDLILFGETKEKIKESGEKYNFENIHLVENMKEAVELAYNLGKEEDNVLLSPACASWGMYSNFEERGIDFKNIVSRLGEEKDV